MTTQTPKLRFPEFSDKWEVKKVEDFAPLQRGFDLPVDNIIKGEYPVVFSNGILKSHIEYKAKAPGVVTGRSGTIGKVTFVEKDYWPHNTALWVTNFKGNYPKYVYYFYHNFNLERFGTGSGVPTLNRNDVHIQKITIPQLPEQTKIANFLTAIDEKIQALKQKKTLLEQYKKGIMQQIFSQELRFKNDDGSDFDDWEEKSLGEISNIKRGASPRPISDKRWFSNISNIGWVRISDVTKSNKFLNKTEQYLSDEGVKKSRFLEKGNLIMSICATIGKPIYTNIPVCIHDGFVVFDDIQADREYVYYYLDFIQDKWYQYGQPGSQVNLNTEIVSNEIINFPSIFEQQKIASFLTAIDEKIEKVSQQITATETYKKGLLQQMFI